MARGCSKSMLNSTCFIRVSLREVPKNEGVGRLVMCGPGGAGWQISTLQANIPTDVQMRPPNTLDRADIGADRDCLLRENGISSIRFKFVFRATSLFGW